MRRLIFAISRAIYDFLMLMAIWFTLRVSEGDALRLLKQWSEKIEKYIEYRKKRNELRTN